MYGSDRKATFIIYDGEQRRALRETGMSVRYDHTNPNRIAFSWPNGTDRWRPVAFGRTAGSPNRFSDAER